MALRIPLTLEEATSVEWLSAALGTRVGSVTAGEVDHRVSTNQPVHLELDDGTTRHLWIKGYFSEIGRQYRSAGVPEAAFYRDLVDRTGVRTLRVVAAAVDFDTAENVLITEDEAGGGARFLHALDPYTPDQAAETLEQLATLHARTWGDPELAELPWLANRLSFYTLTRGIVDIDVNFEGPIGAGVPEAVRDSKRLYEAYQRLGELAATATPWSVIHGDVHIGNVFLDRAGRPSFCDWQLVQRGPWYLDVGYHIGAVLTVEDRRRTEQDLLRHYLDRLAAGGIDVPGIDEAQRRVCLGLVHGFYLWGITLKVDPRKTAVLLERLGTAVADHDAYDAIAGCR
jgi:Phosphotransferase enzyme family